MSKILTNPGSACEQAIERSFTRRNWRHVVMYAIDPTQFPGSNKTNVIFKSIVFNAMTLNTLNANIHIIHLPGTYVDIGLI